MKIVFTSSRFLRLSGLILLFSLSIVAQIPSPKSVLGFEPTDDKTIADWSQIVDYFGKLGKASPKVEVREVGRSTNGSPLIVAFISSADNIRNLEKYRRINAKLADPRTIKGESELAGLIRDGKTVVSISCSIHSTEIVASQMSMNLAYQLATATDAETKEILDDTILLLIPSSNPDGVKIVADWYRKTLGTKSEGTSPPELYHHYAGHDNNRDWFMLNLVETQAITKLYWQQWFPQFVYDVHQQGQNASRFIIPPFFDPPNPRVSPSILREVGLVGYKMAADLQANGVAGVATNSTYDTWWHGGFRSAPYYHNSIGILSEAASVSLMTPITVKKEDLARNRFTRGLPNLLETATNYPETWEGGLWRPVDIANIEMTASRSLLQMAAKFRPRYLRNFYDYGKANLVKQPDEPQAYIISAGQPNAEAVARLIEILMAQGVDVYQMTKELWVKVTPNVDFHETPLGGYLVFVNQPQKNNILSLFEKQVYPHRLLPNGEAEPPYDVAGWTLPLQMGVAYDAAWDIRDMEKDTATLKRLTNINQARAALGLNQTGTPFKGVKYPLRSTPQIALYRGSTGSMDEGWTRLMLDTFGIAYRRLSDADARSGNFVCGQTMSSGGGVNCDAVILPADSGNTIVKGLSPERYPAEFAGGIGDEGVDNLKKYVTEGGKLICFDDSCDLVIKTFGLPIKNVLSGLKRSEFYNPGSIVQLAVDNKSKLGNGFGTEVAAYFSNSSAYEVASDAGATIVARYASKDALLSGWMLGEKFLNDKAALVEVTVGKGKIVLFAFRPQHRGQSWATFPFIFNALEK
ncbi:MAG TPA: M14 family metallopeptidase [Pyrinomonadaceae bacterium]|nr:hypothetical protein [Chloracidobacterium sp.]MBP9936039.1 hypothetical protein [Pyrinomonadaceae bacterium]MBK7802148.1 hypothetical protein [Chloracidobacterium sp.]MBL0239695.1 hypothetical protein [Chloracidobacterium sp.]HQX54754.1 M14 family metallopeptidase [Pyrinomonadaceae bacterium]